MLPKGLNLHPMIIAASSQPTTLKVFNSEKVNELSSI